MKKWIVGVTATIALGATVPVVPQDMAWLYSYERTCVYTPLTVTTATGTYSTVEKYKPKKCEGDKAFISVFADQNGNIQYVETPGQQYRDMAKKDGEKRNPKASDYVSLLQAVTPIAKAAIAFDASVSANADPASSLTFSHTVGSGSNRILFVGDAKYITTTDDSSTVTYNGDSLTKINSGAHASNGRAWLWYMVAPASGAHNVVVTRTGSTNIQPSASSYSGASQTGVPDAQNCGASSGLQSSITVSVTVVTADSWGVMMAMGGANGHRATGGAGTTQRSQGASGNGNSILDSNGTWSAGSHSLVGSDPVGTDAWSACVASFAPAAGAVIVPDVDDGQVI